MIIYKDISFKIKRNKRIMKKMYKHDKIGQVQKNSIKHVSYVGG